MTLSARPFEFLKPAITWFNVDMDNKKTATTTTYETDTGTYYYYTESDELRRGIELSVSGKISDFGVTTYKFGWTRMMKIESTSGGVTTDSTGVTNPKNLFTVMLAQKWRAYSANVTVRTVDDWTDSSTGVTGLGGYTRVDVNVQRDFVIRDHRLNVAIYSRNLTNERYATRYKTGYYYDRGLVIGTQLTFEF